MPLIPLLTFPAWFSDDFNRANGPLGSNWIGNGGQGQPDQPEVVNNEVVGGLGATIALRWINPTTTENQVAEMDYRGNNNVGVAVAMPGFAAGAGGGGLAPFYVFRQATATTLAISEKNAGATSFTNLATFARTPTIGDRLRLEYSNGVLTGYVNGTQVITHTPASPITGQLYVGASLINTNLEDLPIWDNWSGGDLSYQPPAQTCGPSSIASSETFGSPVLTNDSTVTTISPTAIASNETHGSPIITSGTVLSPNGIRSGEALGYNRTGQQGTYTGRSAVTTLGQMPTTPLLTQISGLAFSRKHNAIYANTDTGAGGFDGVYMISPTDASLLATLTFPGIDLLDAEAMVYDAVRNAYIVADTGNTGGGLALKAVQFDEPVTLTDQTITGTSYSVTYADNATSRTGESYMVDPTTGRHKIIGRSSGNFFDGPLALGDGNNVFTSTAVTLSTGVADAEYSPDGRFLVVAHAVDEMIRLYNASDMSLVDEWSSGLTAGQVEAVCFNRDGTEVYWANDSGNNSVGSTLMKLTLNFSYPSPVTTSPVGIPTSEAHGAPTLTTLTTLLAAGIASGQAFGNPTRTSSIILSPDAIDDGSVFGVPVRTSSIVLSPAGIVDGGGFGSPVVSAVIVLSPTAIDDSSIFGSPTATVVIPGQTINPTAIDDSSVFGSPVLTRNVTLVPNGIVSGEALGAPTRSSVVVLVPVSIGSAQAVPSPVLGSVVTLFPPGVASLESFGNPTRSGAVTLLPSSIADPDVFGTPSAGSGLTISPTGIVSGQAFGTPVRTSTITLLPVSIADPDLFGNPTFNVKWRLLPTGIVSAQVFGTPVRTSVVVMRPGGILGAEIVPNVVLSGDGAISTFSGWGIPLG